MIIAMWEQHSSTYGRYLLLFLPSCCCCPLYCTRERECVCMCEMFVVHLSYFTGNSKTGGEQQAQKSKTGGVDDQCT